MDREVVEQKLESLRNCLRRIETRCPVDGLVVTSDGADFLYKTTRCYAPEAERCIRWDDPAIAIDWPTLGRPPQLSAKDAAAPLLVDATLPG